MNNLRKLWNEYKDVYGSLPPRLQSYVNDLIWGELCFMFNTKKPRAKRPSSSAAKTVVAKQVRRKFSEIIEESEAAKKEIA